MLDSGSNITVISDHTAKKLGLIGSERSLILKTANGICTHNVRDVEFQIQSLESKFKTQKIRAVTLNEEIKLCGTNTDPHNYSHLRDLKFHRNYASNSEQHIDIILGVPYALDILLSSKLIEGKTGEPKAISTVLGNILIEEEALSSNSNFHIEQLASDDIAFDLQRFWSYDAIGICDLDVPLTEDQVKAENMFNANTYYNPLEKRFYTRILWKDLNDRFHNNKGRAISVMNSVRDRHQKDLALIDKAYQDLLDNGFAEIIRPDQIKPTDERKVYYLECHPVLKTERESTKCRIVMNCKSIPKGSDRSINDRIYQGICLLPSLIRLLLQFRTKPYAVIADISNMFMNVRISESSKDRDAMRFVWIFQNDPSKMVEMRLTSMGFGFIDSPYKSDGVCIKLADAFQHKYPLAAEVVKNSRYVDDISKSECNPEQLKNLLLQLMALFSEASMKPHKINSNCKEVLKCLPDEAISQKDIMSVLGILWNTLEDTLTFQITKAIEIETTPTMRTVSKTLSSIFDPLQLLIPFTVRGKLLIQQLWKEKYSWDQCLKGPILDTYLSWKKEISMIQQITLERQIDVDNAKDSYIVIFTDASKVAYSAVAYLVTQDYDGTTKSCIITAKNRAAPTKYAKKLTPQDLDEILEETIVRLELLGCLIGARLYCFLKDVYKVNNYYLFSDSMINIWRIKTRKPSQYSFFVSNKLKEIQSRTDINNWKFCPGILNCADLATRGISASDLLNSKTWWSGADFLTDFSQQSWPKNDTIGLSKYQQGIDNFERESSSKNVLFVTESSSVLDEILKKYEKWYKAVNVNAYVQRAIACFQKKSLKSQVQSGQLELISYKKFGDRPGNIIDTKNPLTSKDIRNSERDFVRNAQLQKFPKEIHCLKTGLPISKQSPLRDLRPYWDDQLQILRMKSRLVDSKFLSEGTTNPIILPKGDIVTNKLVIHLHQLLFKATPETTHNMLRKNYHLSCGREVIRNLIRKCVCCKLPFPLQAQCGDLPDQRIDHQSPWRAASVDFGGPFLAVHRCNLEQCTHSDVLDKVYYTIFTDMTTRAVHLELVKDLTTHTFLMSFENFTNRRGMVNFMFSDCAKTFKTAGKELKRALSQIDWNHVRHKGLAKGIEWQFNKEKAPWMIGVCERLNRNIKSAVRSTLKARQLTFEEMNNLFIQCEALINNRPLTNVKSASDDEILGTSITPAELCISRTIEVQPTISPKLARVSDFAKYKRERQLIHKIFWRRWTHDYLLSLRKVPTFHDQKGSVNINDIVLIRDDNLNFNEYKMGRIIELLPSRDSKIRAVRLKLPQGSIITRPVNRLAKFEADEN